MLDHVEYILHPTFAVPRREVKHEPYELEEKGWGEFDLRIVLWFMDRFAPNEVIIFDLNFQQSQYYKIHIIEFRDLPVNTISYLESLKAIGRESQKGSKKLPSTYNSNNHHSNNTHDENQSMDDDDDLSSGPGINSPSPPQSIPVLSPSSESLTPNQDFDEISPLSETQELNDNGNDGLSDKDVVEDEVLNVDDLKHINSVHYMDHDPETCQVWGIPEHFNMVELARRLNLLSESQAERVNYIVQKYKNNSMSVEEKDDYLTLDLYSLGPTILNHLWTYTETIFDNDNR
ncbi:unnamed protein product [Cunninghamella blakesleeana]